MNRDSLTTDADGVTKVTVGMWTAFWRVGVMILTALAAAAPLIIWALMDSHNDMRYFTKSEHLVERANDMIVSEMRDRLHTQLITTMQLDLAKLAIAQEKISGELARINRSEK